MDEGYNGWANYQTWNVFLWLGGSDEALYNLTRAAGSYKATVEELRQRGIRSTPDGVAYDDTRLDLEALEEAVRELNV